jgi:hypothetical protein
MSLFPLRFSLLRYNGISFSLRNLLNSSIFSTTSNSAFIILLDLKQQEPIWICPNALHNIHNESIRRPQL